MTLLAPLPQAAGILLRVESGRDEHIAVTGVGSNIKWSRKATYDQFTIHEHFGAVDRYVQIKQQSAVGVASLRIPLDAHHTANGQELRKKLCGLRPVTLHTFGGVLGFGSVDTDESHGFGGAGDAQTNGVTIDDEYDACLIGGSRRGGVGGTASGGDGERDK